MPGNSKVFVSYAHADNERCQPLISALSAWNADYWFDVESLEAGAGLSDNIQRAIVERDVFLRVCTTASQQSYWCKLELGAFRGLLAADHKRRRDGRVLINFILDRDYRPEPFDLGTIYIDAAGKKPAEWLPELRRALDRHGAIPQPAVPAETVAAPEASPTAPAGTAARPEQAGSRRPRIGQVIRRPGNGLVASLAAALVVIAFAAVALTANGAGLLGQARTTATTLLGTPTPTWTPEPTEPPPTATRLPITSFLKYTLTTPLPDGWHMGGSSTTGQEYSVNDSFTYDAGTTTDPNTGVTVTPALSIERTQTYYEAYGSATNGSGPILNFQLANASCQGREYPMAEEAQPRTIWINIFCQGYGHYYLLSINDLAANYGQDYKTLFAPLMSSIKLLP